MLQNAAPHRKSAPGPPNMSDSCVSTPRKMHLCRSSSIRHNRMHFFDSSTSKSAPTLRCFVHFDFEMCFAPHRRAIFHLSSRAALASLLFDPPEPQNIGKNTLFRDFSTFSRTCIFFLLTLFLLLSSFFFSSLLWLFPPLLFHPSILSEVWLLNFLRIYQCLHHNDVIWYQSCDAWWVSLYYDVYYKNRNIYIYICSAFVFSISLLIIYVISPLYPNCS